MLLTKLAHSEARKYIFALSHRKKIIWFQVELMKKIHVLSIRFHV